MEKSLPLKLAKSIADSLHQGIQKNGNASLVVCGGKSPIEIFHQLSQIDINWSQVTILLGDDRFVDASHTDSNERLIKENLLINKAMNAQYISLLHPRLSNDALTFLFDVVIVGLGMDGHFASLFPSLVGQSHALNLNALPDFYTSKHVLGDPAYKRITMNLSMLMNTHRCILLVSSSSKRQIINEAKTNKELPIHYLLTQTKIKIECSDVDF